MPASSINQWYNQRTLKERLLLLICGLVVLGFLLNLSVFAPQSERRRSVRKEMSELEHQLAELKAQEVIIGARKSVDPNRDMRLKLDSLGQEALQLQEQLEARIVNLVAPEEMPGLLKELLTRQKKLQLMRLENLAPQRLEFQSDTVAEVNGPDLFQHSFQMEFSGDYLTLLAYLRQLESLSKRLVIEAVDVETKEYPVAVVRLQVSTLSLTEGWIGG